MTWRTIIDGNDRLAATLTRNGRPVARVFQLGTKGRRWRVEFRRAGVWVCDRKLSFESMTSAKAAAENMS